MSWLEFFLEFVGVFGGVSGFWKIEVDYFLFFRGGFEIVIRVFVVILSLVLIFVWYVRLIVGS